MKNLQKQKMGGKAIFIPRFYVNWLIPLVNTKILSSDELIFNFIIL